MLLAFLIIIPLAASFLTALIGAKGIKRFCSPLAILASLSLLSISLVCLKLCETAGSLTYKWAGWQYPLGLSISADSLSVFMLIVVNLIAFLALIYAFSYTREFTGEWKFYSLFLLMLAGMNGVIISTDLFNLYVFLELASISGYALVAFGAQAEHFEASFKYAVMGALASIFILLGIALIYGFTATTNMADIPFVLAQKPHSLLLGFISVLFLTGFGLKAALVPFHAWLPDAHSCAPTPVSAVLSGVFIKTLGVYALARVFYNVIGLRENVLFAMMVLGALSMVVGAILALAQKDIKRMLAYSSISQIGYIVLAFGIATPLAILGGLLHIFNHAILKSLLFLNAGAIEYSARTRRLDKLGGLKDKLAFTSLTAFVASMSISGVPPLGGFWSKLIIILAAVQAGRMGFAAIAVGVSIITLVYYLRFYSKVFLGKPAVGQEEPKQLPFSMKFSMAVLAVLCVLSGLLLTPKFSSFLNSAVNVLSR